MSDNRTFDRANPVDWYRALVPDGTVGPRPNTPGGNGSDAASEPPTDDGQTQPGRSFISGIMEYVQNFFANLLVQSGLGGFGGL